MRNIQVDFEHEQFFHVFNRTNNSEALFYKDGNKIYFLELIQKRLSGYVKFYAYALLRNHFHFAISVRSEEEILEYIQQLSNEERKISETTFLEAENRNIHKLISSQFSRVFNSYSQAINKQNNRIGNLFHKPFKRSKIRNNAKFSFLLYYLHHNSRKHGVVKNFLSDPWHSYQEILNGTSSLIDIKFIMEWFGGKNKFVEFHKGKYLESDFKEVWIE